MRFISCTSKSSSCVISPCVSKRTDDDGNVPYHRRRASPTLPTLPRAITPEHMDIASLYRWKKRILLVEDHEDEWEMVALKLREYKLTFARDFDEGLRFAKQRRFELYILDNWLPDGSGVELCRVIRVFDPITPILFYSAVTDDRDMKEALRSGAQSYLVKPVSLDDLEQEVARLTSPRRRKGL
jgi:CheY-like chemotaxis protein